MQKKLATVITVSMLHHASAAVIIGAGTGEGNGDFAYDGGATSTATINENIPRDRALIGSGTAGDSLDNNASWTMTRVAYSGGNNAFGWDGNFGFDDAAFEAANTGTGQAFINGNANSIADLAATIASSGAAGETVNLSYLLGSDSAGGTATVTITLDAGLGSEQVVNFATQTRAGTSRAGANTVTESFVAAADFSTVDVNFRMQNATGSTRTLIDDVRLESVPEPSSALLTGLAALGLLRRRR